MLALSRPGRLTDIMRHREKAMATFRSAFFPIWRVTTEWSSGIAVIILCVMGVMGGAIPLLLHLLVLALSATLGSVLVMLANAYYSVDLTDEGLLCYDAYGLYRLAQWNAITGVRPVNFLGLRYLRVYSTDTTRPRWLPLFLSDMPRFADTAFTLAGPENPLVQALPR